MNPEQPQFELPKPGTPESLAFDKKLEEMHQQGSQDLENQLAALTPEQREAFQKAVEARDQTDRSIQ